MLTIPFCRQVYQKLLPKCFSFSFLFFIHFFHLIYMDITKVQQQIFAYTLSLDSDSKEMKIKT